MPIIEKRQFPEMTLDQKKLRAKNQIKGSITQSFERLQKDFMDNYNFVWNNPMGLTPQQVLDSVGTDASQLYLIADTIGAAINALDPTWVPPSAPYLYTINEDGTVTVGELAPQT